MALPLGTDIRLSGNTYVLARGENVAKVLGATGRRWHVERKKAATKRTPRPDVRPGEIDGEWIITWDDWSKGIAGDHENLPGCYHYAENVETRYRGAVHGVGAHTVVTHVNNCEAPPIAIVPFDAHAVGGTYIFGGEYAWRWYGAFWAMGVAKDFTTGKSPTDVVIHNNLLVVAMGETENIYTMDTSETFTQATDDVDATRLAVMPDGRLWRAHNSNEVSSIAPTDSPLTLTNWGAAITVGDDDRAITRLNPYGHRLAVSKEEGLFIGEQTAAGFVNVLPGIVPDPDNGKYTFVRGSDIFYNTRYSLYRYNNGIIENVSLRRIFTSAGLDFGNGLPGTSISASCVDGDDIYIATKPSYFPRADPTGALKTVDNENNFTSLLTNLADNDNASYANLVLDTAANGDYLYFGYSANFYGLIFDLGLVNDNASVLTVQYWNGSAWTAMGDGPNPVTRTVHDGTSLNGATFRQAGVISWSNVPSDWADKSINGTTARWVRLSVSASIDTVYASSCRIVTNRPACYVFRGRARRRDDVRDSSFIWDCVYYSNQIAQPYITAMSVINPSGQNPPQRRAATLVLAAQNTKIDIELGPTALDGPLDGIAGSLYLQRHDGGMPEVNKEFLDFTIKGKKIDANHTVDLAYNLNEQTTTWNSVATNIASSPSTTTLSANKTGYSIQPRITIDDFSHDEVTEINELECRFREIPTYKNEYTMVLELGDGQVSGNGTQLPVASVQLTNLETAHTAGPITLIDPANRSESVMVQSIKELELIQDADGYPVLLVEIRATEV